MASLETRPDRVRRRGQIEPVLRRRHAVSDRGGSRYFLAEAARHPTTPEQTVFRSLDRQPAGVLLRLRLESPIGSLEQGSIGDPGLFRGRSQRTEPGIL